MINIDRTRCEGMENPMGISCLEPRLTWILVSDERNIKQSSYRLWIFSENQENKHIELYDSGEITSDKPYHIVKNFAFESTKRYYWQVVIRSQDDRVITSEINWFEMGILKETEWKAKWILPEREKVFADVRGYVGYDEPKMSKEIPEEHMLPCPLIRKAFVIKKKAIRARAYATAHGIYRLYLNGKRVGNLEFAPEITPYDKYLQVQAYDITELLQMEGNTLGIALAEGWWAGRLGHYGESVQYGDELAALVQMHVIYEDGEEEIIGTDGGEISGEGARRYGELYIGEKYDAAKEQPGWSENNFETNSSWNKVHVTDYGYKQLTGQNAQPVMVVREVENTRVYQSPKGETIIDFGQAMSGNAVMHLKGQAGAKVMLKYFEETDKEQNYWFELDGRNSQQIDTFILGESGEGEYDPWFTCHGYRYICLMSDKGEVTATQIKGRLIASNVEQTLKIETSNPYVNRLQKNIEWTLISNMMSVLTDNPDRERAGWTGDLQMIFPTMAYNFDVQSFIRRWLNEARLEQFDNGMIPTVIPFWKIYQNMPFQTSAGWGDVITIVPWLMYERYGDTRILEENYDAMQKWVDYETERAQILNEQAQKMSSEEQELQKYIWNADFNYGDWLTPSACYDPETETYTYFTQTICYLIGAYYHAWSARIMSMTAEVLGYGDDQKMYQELYQKIRNSVIKEIYYKTGIVDSEFMGAQVLALQMGFYPENGKKILLDRILELIKQRGMDCGFSSVLEISDILCENGYVEEAYDFLLNEQFPSWIYEVKNGATTVWESMQAIMPDGKRNAVSFIQPAFCSIGNWMVQGMCGIRSLEAGYQKIKISPYFTDRLSFAEAEYDSIHGKISSRWEIEEAKIRLSVEIPANTEAEIYLPGGNITESGKTIEQSSVEKSGTRYMIRVGSGKYEFVCDRK